MSADQLPLTVKDIKEYVLGKFENEDVPRFLINCFRTFSIMCDEETVDKTLAETTEKFNVAREDFITEFLLTILFPYTLWGTMSLSVRASDLEILFKKNLVSLRQLQSLQSALQIAQDET